MKTLKDYLSTDLKSLETSLYEASLLDIEGTIEGGEEAIKDKIEKWINDNFKATDLKISNNPNCNGKYEVSAKYVSINNHNITSLTNDIFVWNKIKNDFSCANCQFLTSLEGAPKEIGGNFYCTYCHALKSLEGAPEKVGKSFHCYNCSSLTTLEGAPKEVGGSFDCSGCNSLTSLEGAPDKVNGYFDCYNCKYLKSTDLPATTKIKGKIFK